MKRLVYSPSVNAWIKTDTGIFDLSPYITDFNIDRRVNEVSSAQLTFRNPKIPSLDKKKQRFMFTEHEHLDGTISPMFHPMDPIIITLTRLRGKPIQVFTGYCDTTPYVQIYPGVATLDASCTLKRLQYTYWDPGLPFIRNFLSQNGWEISANGTAVNPQAEGDRSIYLNDSSIGFLLYKVLEEVGNWDRKNIFIQELPGRQINDLIINLFDDVQKANVDSIQDFHNFLKETIGASEYGDAGTTSTGNASEGDTAWNGSPVGPKTPWKDGYPLAVKGTWGGGVRDHKNRALGDWQSDNAVDINVPVGTRVFAIDDGTIINVRGSYSTGEGGTEGLRFTLVTNNNSWFYQHNCERYVVENQRVKKGDLLALSGAGNSVPHLHLGSKNGDPGEIIGWPRSS